MNLLMLQSMCKSTTEDDRSKKTLCKYNKIHLGSHLMSE